MKIGRSMLLMASIALICFAIAFSASMLLVQQSTKTIIVTETQPVLGEQQYREGVKHLLEGVVGWVEEHRGLSLEENVSIEVLTKNWVIEHWGKGFLNVTEVTLEEKILKSLFIVPQDFNLTKFKIGTSGCTIAASSGHTIYVVKELFDPNDKPRAASILAHELTHILQGEHFTIPAAETSDGEKAILALIEGDANLVASHYLLEHGIRREKIWERALRPIDALWFFPYLYGEQFVEFIYQKRGWSGVNAVYSDPPKSTAEILHPDKYLSGWKPIDVSLPEEVGDGWKLMLKDTLGEFFIREMLRTHLSYSGANESADGWLGDSVHLYEGNKTYLVKWKIVWETEGDAEDFMKSFKKILQDVGAAEIDHNTWRTSYEAVELQLSGRQTLITIISPPVEKLSSSSTPIVA